ncbi:MAG: hypothetical protein GY694_17050 [Gammaproteobacteria bacterium]|nr:hypothetical protein [Gammaproteobacteria bacterium]
MKRIAQLQNLSKEHHLSLTLAQKVIKISEAQNTEAIAGLCQEIVHDYPTTWKVHFKIEEDSIFQTFLEAEPELKHSSEIRKLCLQLVQEHQTMNDFYEQMKQGDYSCLGQFGVLLKKHTRTEERELFPLLEESLSTEALNHIFEVSQDYRK